MCEIILHSSFVYTATADLNEAMLRHTCRISSAASQIICVVVAAIVLRLGDAASLFEERSSSYSANARSSDVGQNDVPTMEEEGSSGSALEGVTGAANGGAVAVASSNAGLTSRNVFDGVDSAATTTMEMYQEQTVQAQLLRADRDQCRRTHGIENFQTMPPIPDDESTADLVGPTTMPLIAVAPPEVNAQTIQRLPTNILSPTKDEDTCALPKVRNSAHTVLK